MATFIEDLGIVSAYGEAVRKGYTGTEEEFAEMLANLPDKLAEAREYAASAAESSASAASSAAGVQRNASIASTAASDAQSAAASALQSATFAETTVEGIEEHEEQCRIYRAEAVAAAEELKTTTLWNDALIDETVTGKIASFSDGCAGMPMKSIVAEITPVQSGTGDPSPTNIRPISGRTGLTVTRAGKNLLKMPTYAEISAASTVVSYKSIALQLFPNTTYYLSTKFINGYTANGKGMYILLTNSATTNEPWVAVAHSGNVNGKVDGTITTNADGLLYLRFNGVTEDKLTQLYANSEIQLEVGSTATAYEPYHGTTYPITWQTEAGAIYGGTLDVVSGVLTVDKGYASFDGSENWNWQDGGTYKRAACPLSDVYNPGGRVSIQSNAGTFRASGNDVGTIFASGTTLFYYPDASITSLADYKTWLASNNLQIVYPLATPQTYQLTPTEVRTILGENLVYSDADDVTVNYYVDMKGYIDKRLNTTRMMIAGVETSFVATKNYAIGDFVIVNDTLYRITAVITSGETITPGTNASETTVAEQLIALYNA